MSEGLLVLAGAVIGVLGTLVVDFLGGRREHDRAGVEALRQAGSDFTAQLARARRVNLELAAEPGSSERWARSEQAYTDLRAHYERLLLSADDVRTQETAREILHEVHWMQMATAHKLEEVDVRHRRLIDLASQLYKQLRRELGARHPDAVYREPPGRFPPPDWAPPA